MRIAYFRRITKFGNSYCIVIPKEIRTIIEADRGDWLRIEVEKIDSNIHDDNAARQGPEARNNGIHKDEGHSQMDNSKGIRVNGIQTLAGEDIHFRIL